MSIFVRRGVCVRNFAQTLEPDLTIDFGWVSVCCALCGYQIMNMLSCLVCCRWNFCGRDLDERWFFIWVWMLQRVREDVYLDEIRLWYNYLGSDISRDFGRINVYARWNCACVMDIGWVDVCNTLDLIWHWILEVQVNVNLYSALCGDRMMNTLFCVDCCRFQMTISGFECHRRNGFNGSVREVRLSCVRVIWVQILEWMAPYLASGVKGENGLVYSYVRWNNLMYLRLIWVRILEWMGALFRFKCHRRL